MLRFEKNKDDGFQLKTDDRHLEIMRLEMGGLGAYGPTLRGLAPDDDGLYVILLPADEADLDDISAIVGAISQKAGTEILRAINAL